jgi:hypothetical protein
VAAIAAAVAVALGLGMWMQGGGDVAEPARHPGKTLALDTPDGLRHAVAVTVPQTQPAEAIDQDLAVLSYRVDQTRAPVTWDSFDGAMDETYAAVDTADEAARF